MPRALGTTVTVLPDEPLSRYDFYLLLPDALFEVANKKANAHLGQLAESFSHDVLNLAALAGRLLWYEGVSPDVWRSHDLIPVGVDIESYFVMLQTACDVMADVIVTLGAKKGQGPYDSFHALKNWVARNPVRLAEQFRFVNNPLPWFDVINSVRTKLVHRGGKVWVFTDRLRFQWSVHGEAWRGIRRLTREIYLLPELKSLTRAVLRFSRRLARAVREYTGVTARHTHVISGDFVPALQHLFTYKPPTASARLVLSGKCLAACGDYATATRLGYPDGFWWKFLLHLAELFGGGPHNLSVPLGTSDGVHDCKAMFSYHNRLHGLLVCDEIGSSQKWWRGAEKSLSSLVKAWGLDSAVLVGRTIVGELTGDASIEPIVGHDPDATAEVVFNRLVKK